MKKKDTLVITLTDFEFNEENDTMTGTFLAVHKKKKK